MSLLRFLGCMLLLALSAMSACSDDVMPPLVATDIEITAAMPGRQMSAGYLSLTNNTDITITITSVVSPEFASVEIHESLLEDGIARMRRLAELSIPAHSTLTLERGGKHLMLMRPSGNTQQVSLSFNSGDTIVLGVRATISPRNN